MHVFIIEFKKSGPFLMKSKYMEIGRHRGMIANAYEDSNFYGKVETFNYLGSLLTNQNSVQDEIKC